MTVYWCRMFSISSTSSTLHTPCMLFPARYSLHAIPCTLFPACYSLHAIPCTLFPARYSLHAIPCTLLPARYSLYATPCTLFPARYSLQVQEFSDMYSDFRQYRSTTSQSMKLDVSYEMISGSFSEEYQSNKANQVGPTSLCV